MSTPKRQTLTVYNDDSTPLTWPNDDRTDRETWRLTLVSVYGLKPQDPTITALPVCYLLVQWDRKNSTLAIAPYRQPDPSAPRSPSLSSDPPAPITLAETAVLEWLRRIHSRGKTGFQKGYPGLVARYPDGDVFGYLIESSVEGMERALQETIFNEYAELRRLYVILIAPNDRETTAALGTMPNRKFPARTSVVVGHIQNSSGVTPLFIPDEEHPTQNTWR